MRSGRRGGVVVGGISDLRQKDHAYWAWPQAAWRSEAGPEGKRLGEVLVGGRGFVLRRLLWQALLVYSPLNFLLSRVVFPSGLVLELQS